MTKQRTCKQCKVRFDEDDGVRTPAGRFCGAPHAFQWAIKRRDANKAKALRAQQRARKEAALTNTEWANKLQIEVNKYVRLRDKADGCISCDKPATWAGQFHASHFYSRGHSSALRFNLWNLHRACSQCNNHLSSNHEGYAPALVEKIGQERVDWLTAHKSDVVRRDAEWYKRAIRIARRGIKRLERHHSP